MNKFKTFIAMYKNIIILLWWLIILITFKITTNFIFSNGNSIIFVLLLVVIPLTLYILAIIFKRNLLKNKKKSKLPYLERINNDYQDKTFNKEFISKIKEYNFSTTSYDNMIIVSNELLEISFNDKCTVLSIKETDVYFRYYYQNKFSGISKYDKKYLQYKNTKYLYNLLVNKINLLLSNKLIYQTKGKTVKLTIADSGEILYTNAKKLSLKDKYKIIKVINENVEGS